MKILLIALFSFTVFADSISLQVGNEFGNTFNSNFEGKNYRLDYTAEAMPLVKFGIGAGMSNDTFANYINFDRKNVDFFVEFNKKFGRIRPFAGIGFGYSMMNIEIVNKEMNYYNQYYGYYQPSYNYYNNYIVKEYRVNSTYTLLFIGGEFLLTKQIGVFAKGMLYNYSYTGHSRKGQQNFYNNPYQQQIDYNERLLKDLADSNAYVMSIGINFNF